MNPVKSWMTLKTGKCDEYKHWDGSTALHLAAEFNQVKIAKELIMDGAGTSFSACYLYLKSLSHLCCKHSSHLC